MLVGALLGCMTSAGRNCPSEPPWTSRILHTSVIVYFLMADIAREGSAVWTGESKLFSMSFGWVLTC